MSLPSLFLSHGSPMLALDTEVRAGYRDLGQSIARPRAILMMSAHWETEHLNLGELKTHQDLIYDFYGFPESLYTLRYSAPSADFLLPLLQDCLQLCLPIVERGLDHGVWIPLLSMYPDADIPVLQLSLPRDWDDHALFELGQKLAPLREHGILIVAGGTLTHNLAALRATNQAEIVAAAHAFDASIASILQARDLTALLNWRNLPFATINHPSAEHFRPLLFAAGAGGWQKTEFVMEGFEMGLFSRRSVLFF